LKAGNGWILFLFPKEMNGKILKNELKRIKN
jgi:hypothetical protein